MKSISLCILLLLLAVGCSIVAPVSFPSVEISEKVYGVLTLAPSSQKTVLILPGASGFDEGYEEFAENFRRVGWNALIVDYYRNGKDLPSASVFTYDPELWESWKSNIEEAITLIRNNKMGDYSNIVLMGFSRGASLAFEVSKKHRLKGLILLYGNIFPVKDTVKDSLSFIRNTPPTLLIHGTKDRIVKDKYSIEAFHLLKKYGIKSELLLLDSVGHAFVLKHSEKDRVARNISIQLSVEFLQK